MRLLTLAGRPLLASTFITGGLAAARAPGGRTDAAAKLGLPQPELMVRLNGAAMLLGGAALAVGYKPRRAALLLAGTLLPTTYAGHAFWAQEDPAEKVGSQIHFFKNASMLGGLLAVAGDSPRKAQPRSARKAAKQVGKAAVAAAWETEKAQDKLSRQARRRAAKVEAKAAKRADKVQTKAAAKAGALQAKAEAATDVQAKDTKKALKTAGKAEKAAGAVADATQRAAKADAKAERKALKLSGKAAQQASRVQDDMAARRELASAVGRGSDA